MRKYDLSKDSGVEWIGEIPSHWERKKLGYLVNLQGRIGFKGYKKTDFVDEGKGCLVIGGKHIDKNNKINFSDPDYLNWEKYYESPEIMVFKGDLIVSQRGTLGKVLFIEEDYGPLTINPSLVILNQIKENPKYLWYFLHSDCIMRTIDILGSVTTIPMLSQDEISKFPIIVPPLSEQQQIVSYLDTKTSLIDSLIEKTQRKIELLNEKRTSLINEVVTKGLNPNVELKDSGVEWIGEIPSHWERKRLKHITRSINGFSFKSDDFDREFDIPVIRIGDVGDVIDFNDCIKVKSHFLEDKKEYVVMKDDILIGLTGGTIGKSGKYNYNSPSLLNQRVGLLRNKPSVLNGLLYHYVKSEVFIRYIFFDCYGGGQDNISMVDILNMLFPFPPLSEQQQIVSYLDEHTQLIDNTIFVEQRRIDTLKEYRQSLISEVVTGKIDVILN